jgi:MFS family permease
MSNSSITFRGTFSALRHRNYRLWFIGQMVSLIGTWMQGTAQGYLVYTLTGSAAFLGYVSFVSGVPTWLFTLYGGLIADMMPRRTLLIITQTVMMLLAFVMAGLVFLGWIQPWMIILLSFLLGIANSFDAPARQAFVVELVEREDLVNAIALNGTMFNASVVVGPAVAGLTYAAFGPGWCFTLNGVSFIAVIIALAFMRMVPFKRIVTTVSNISHLKEGLRFTLANKVLVTLILNIGMVNLLSNGMMTLLPAWAVEVLHGDVTTNGLLVSARGIGALIGGLSIAALSNHRIKGRLWLYGSFISPILMIIFALLHWLPASLIMLSLIGLGFMLVGNVTNALVQTQVSDELRGRVMGIYTLVMFGVMPIGSLISGVVADRIGETITIIISAVILLVVTTIIRLTNPEIQKMG